MVNQEFLESLVRTTGIDSRRLSSLLTVPTFEQQGDFTIPCFSFAKELRKSPAAIAQELSLTQRGNPFIESAEAVNGYVNLFVEREWYARTILEEATHPGLAGPEGTKGAGKRVAVEFSSPNIAKEFGVGHLRSTLIGNAIANTLALQGYDITKINYLGDWGTQFGKLIHAFERYGDEERLQESPISHLQDIYVRATMEGTPADADAARIAFKRLEEGEPKATALWSRFREYSLREFERAYQLLNVTFDRIEGESDYRTLATNVADTLEQHGLLTISQDAKGVDLSAHDLGFAIIRKQDDTSIYASRDVAAAIARRETLQFDSMLYEVGAEQGYHFKQVFKVLELLGHSWSKDLEHIEHGLYLGTDGKKLSTRRGTSVNMKELWKAVQEKVEGVYAEGELPDAQTLDRITLAAIAYADLKNYRGHDVIFDPQQIVSMQGNTGPYLLYSYARANSILKRVDLTPYVATRPDEQEYRLLKAIADFTPAAIAAAENRDPSRIANQAHTMSRAFNQFYTTSPVSGHAREPYRAAIVKAFRDTLGKSLRTLGIQPIEHM